MKKFICPVVCILVVVLSVMATTFISQQSLRGLSDFYLSEGQHYSANKDYARAVSALNKAVALNQNSFVAHLALGNTYDKNGNYILALEEYHAALKLATKESKDYNFLVNRIKHLQASTNR